MESTEYRDSGDSVAVSEPVAKKGRGNGKLKFVVQRDDASRLHFDFRLEIGGVLKSWAIPKGPSMNPNEKRLALLIEDFPLKYARFEGILPENRYGTGKIAVWDSGTWEPSEKFSDTKKAFDEGLIEFRLDGQKLKGGFILVEMEYSTAGNGWLLIKREDSYAVDQPYDAAGIK